jgi:hypothetical protein
MPTVQMRNGRPAACRLTTDPPRAGDGKGSNIPVPHACSHDKIAYNTYIQTYLTRSTAPYPSDGSNDIGHAEVG